MEGSILKKPLTCIDSISSVKVSNDYDRKTLKINTLRVTLANYYDVSSKFTDYVKERLINKEIHLYYKSNSSSVMDWFKHRDLNSADESNLIPLVYKGVITRSSFNDNSINIVAEDYTQVKISDKKVPYA